MSLQNQLQTRENELNKEKKIRKQLEQQFEKSTEKRLIKELLPNRSTNNTTSKSWATRPSGYIPPYANPHHPILGPPSQVMKGRLIPPASARIHQGPKAGAYF